MEQSPEKIDQVAMERATDRAHYVSTETIKAALLFLGDPTKLDRVTKKSECKVCYYIHNARIGGAAMTYRDCGICGSKELYGSTSTDVLCMKCAQEYKLCKHCGADRELKPRRKLTL